MRTGLEGSSFGVDELLFGFGLGTPARTDLLVARKRERDRLAVGNHERRFRGAILDGDIVAFYPVGQRRVGDELAVGAPDDRLLGTAVKESHQLIVGVGAVRPAEVLDRLAGHEVHLVVGHSRLGHVVITVISVITLSHRHQTGGIADGGRLPVPARSGDAIERRGVELPSTWLLTNSPM